MKYVRFTASLPEDAMTGVFEYDDEDFEDAVNSGEIHYHGLDFLAVDERLKLDWELVDGPG